MFGVWRKNKPKAIRINLSECPRIDELAPYPADGGERVCFLMQAPKIGVLEEITGRGKPRNRDLAVLAGGENGWWITGPGETSTTSPQAKKIPPNDKVMNGIVVYER